jgi:hypothetical protein
VLPFDEMEDRARAATRPRRSPPRVLRRAFSLTFRAGLYPLLGWCRADLQQHEPQQETNKATADQSPFAQALSTKSPIPKERLRVSNWIVQRLYNYAVKKTVEL